MLSTGSQSSSQSDRHSSPPSSPSSHSQSHQSDSDQSGSDQSGSDQSSRGGGSSSAVLNYIATRSNESPSNLLDDIFEEFTVEEVVDALDDKEVKDILSSFREIDEKQKKWLRKLNLRAEVRRLQARRNDFQAALGRSSNSGAANGGAANGGAANGGAQSHDSRGSGSNQQ